MPWVGQANRDRSKVVLLLIQLRLRCPVSTADVYALLLRLAVGLRLICLGLVLVSFAIPLRFRFLIQDFCARQSSRRQRTDFSALGLPT